MSEWKRYKLEDIIEKFIDYRGKTPPKTNTGIPLITAKIVKSGRILEANEFISQEDYKKWMTRGFPEINDLVLTTEAPLGEVALIKDKNVALAQRIITLRGNSRFLFTPYLKYYFQNTTGQHRLQSRASGTTVFGIKAAVLKKITVHIPTVNEQRAIASVLSNLDDKIDLLHSQNKTLKAMAETLFRQWFVEEAQEGWKDGILGDFADNIKDAIKAHEIQPESIYVGLEHIDRRSIALNQSGLGEEVSSNKYAFARGDILFGKLRPYFHKVCFAPFAGICSTDILVIRPKKPEWFSFCLFAFFQNDVVEYANLGSGGTRMPRTDWGTLKMYPIAIPDAKTIKQFNQIVLPSLDKITYNLNQIRTLEKLHDTLLPKLMSGEVRVAA